MHRQKIAKRWTGWGLLVPLGLAAAATGCKKDPPPPPPAQVAVAQALSALQQAGQKLNDGSKSAPGAPPSPEAMAEAMKAMGQVLGGGQKVNPVSFHELKALLPEDLAGWKRKEAKGEKSGAMGITVAEASARFERDGGASLHVKIVDAGSLSGPLGMAFAGWAMAEIDRESDDEYEKSTTFGGYKAFETYNSKQKTGELKLLLSGRFIVEVRGNGVTMDEIKDAARKLDLKKLQGLKSEAP